jgi:hypothetical protein
MFLLIIKYATTAFLVVLVSELAKRSGRLGALIGALPFIAIIVMIWLHIGKQETEKIANYAFYTFWYVLPSLPMFLLMPFLLHKGINFWISLLCCAALTAICFVITALITKRFGINLIP